VVINKGEVQKPPFVSKAKVLLILREESGRIGNTQLQRAFLAAIKWVQDLGEVLGG